MEECYLIVIGIILVLIILVIKREKTPPKEKSILTKYEILEHFTPREGDTVAVNLYVDITIKGKVVEHIFRIDCPKLELETRVSHWRYQIENKVYNVK